MVRQTENTPYPTRECQRTTCGEPAAELRPAVFHQGKSASFQAMLTPGRPASVSLRDSSIRPRRAGCSKLGEASEHAEMEAKIPGLRREIEAGMPGFPA
jgi:hypothetical protein